MAQRATQTPASSAPRPRRRGRPRANGKVSTLEPKEEILVAAARLFSRQGVGATRITDVAEAIGVSPPSIYYHFADLDDIVRALLDYVVEESAAFATASATGPGTSARRLHALVAQHVGRLIAGPFDLWFVVGMRDADGNRYPSVTTQARAWRDAVARVVVDGAATGEFHPVDSELAVAAVSGLVYAALQERHRGRLVDPVEIADLAVRALGADPDRLDRVQRSVGRRSARTGIPC
jgi:TetR/AcrR family transcriptional regulator